MVNQHTIIGHVGQDAELRTTPSGQDVCTFSVATTEAWKDKDGNQQKKTHWHNVSVWGPIARAVVQMAKKGASVYVLGKVVTKEYDKDGVKHRKTETVVSGYDCAFRLLKDPTPDPGAYVPPSGPAAPATQPTQQQPMQDGDDLPF